MIYTFKTWVPGVITAQPSVVSEQGGSTCYHFLIILLPNLHCVEEALKMTLSLMDDTICLFANEVWSQGILLWSGGWRLYRGRWPFLPRELQWHWRSRPTSAQWHFPRDTLYRPTTAVSLARFGARQWKRVNNSPTFCWLTIFCSIVDRNWWNTRWRRSGRRRLWRPVWRCS